MIESALKNLNIRRVVSIDDDYDLKKNHDKMKQENIDSYFEIGAINEHELQCMHDNGIFQIGELLESQDSIPQLKEISMKIQVYQKKDLPSELLILNQVISELISSQVEVKTMKDFQEVAELTKENTIWILDKEMNTDENAIGDEINLILENHSKNINIFVVYTSDSNLMSLNESWQRRNSFLLELGIEKEVTDLIAYQLFVVEKNSNKISLSRKFKKNLANSIRGYLVYDTVKSMQDVNTNCYSQLLEVTKNFDTLNYSRLRYNFENEGANNLVDILYNILSALEKNCLNDILEKKISNIFAFKNIIGLGNEISQDKLHNMTLNSLMNNKAYQSYFIDKSVNYALDDIHFGDVFNMELSESYKTMLNIHGNTIGIIFSQSCDCTLRLSDRNRNINTFEVGIFEMFDISEGNAQKILRSGVPIYDINKYIDLDDCLERIMIPESILDLCSFNQEGKSELLEASEIEHIKQTKKTKVWEDKLCDYLQSKSILDILFDEKFSELGGLEIFKGKIISEKYKIRFDIENKVFNLQRIGRLNENIAYAAMNITYMKNLRVGRNAIHTLDREEEQEILEALSAV